MPPALRLSAAAAVALPLAALAEAPPMPRPQPGLEPSPAPVERPQPPATEGETEADIEAAAQPEPDATPEPEPDAETEPAPPPVTAPLPRPEPVGPRRPAAGWTLRAVPDGDPVALGGGPGRVVSLAAFCLGGRPWLALELFPQPEAERVRVDFGFGDARIAAPALKEEGAGGAYVLALADGPLAELLTGEGAAATVALDGTQQGSLSLEGSAHAIRGAIASCHDF